MRLIPARLCPPRSILLSALAGCVASSLASAASFPRSFDTEKTPGGPRPAADSAAKFALPPGVRQLYDLADDPAETKNGFASERGRVARFQSILENSAPANRCGGNFEKALRL